MMDSKAEITATHLLQGLEVVVRVLPKTVQTVHRVMVEKEYN